MKETAYSNRELDQKFAGLHEKLSTNRDEIMTELKAIKTQVVFTNGKVRKIILALCALAFFCLGLGISQPQILKLFFAAAI